MGKLALGNHPLVPAGLPRGQCAMTRLANGSIRIDHADPRILISAELLSLVFTNPAPGVSINTGLLRDGENGTPFWEGALLKIEGVNRTVIYRIGEYVSRVHGYIGEWPD